jgi:anthranilate phosphoribosyltransferase
MKHVVPVRKELAVRTIFNFLGPLTNPAGANRQLLGVADRRYQETIAEALLGLDCERALVVSADDGLDEISVAGPTRVIEVRDGATEEWFVTPADLEITEAPLELIAGAEPAENAATVRAVLEGEELGPPRDVVVMNAAAAILAAGAAEDLAAGAARARESIDSGAARDVLSRLTKLTGDLASADE